MEGINQLSKLCVEGENDIWIETAHKMKGGAGMIGAVQLAKMCEIAEGMHHTSKENKEGILKDIQASYARVIDLFEKSIENEKHTDH